MIPVTRHFDRNSFFGSDISAARRPSVRGRGDYDSTARQEAIGGVVQRIEAHAWFLRRGLPAVLPPGALARRLWPRAAPTLAAFAVFMLNSIAVVALTDEHTIDIAGQPTRDEWFILGLLVLVLPVAAAVG